MKKFYQSIGIILLATILCSLHAKAQVRLPSIVSNGMVLQRNEPIKIWGWAKPGEKVTVEFMKKRYSTVTEKDDKWQIKLEPMKA